MKRRLKDIGVFRLGRSEDGVALLLVMVLTLISLIIMAGLLYMITSGIKGSGLQKRYKTAFEAAQGGATFAFQIIGLQGDSVALNSAFPTNSFFTYSISSNNYNTTNCLNVKLGNPTGSWGSCSNSPSMNPTDSTTYDFAVNFPGDLFTPSYTAVGKITDTVLGNSGADTGLSANTGVTSGGTGEIPVMSIPFLYTIEIDAENPNNRDERSKLSVLYQY